MKIRTKMLLILIPTITIALFIICGINYIKTWDSASKAAHNFAVSLAQEHESNMLEKFDYAEAVCLGLTNTLQRFQQDGNVSRQTLRETVGGMASITRDFVGVWALWAKNAYDGKDAAFVGNVDLGNSTGRANAYWIYENGVLVYNESDGYDAEPYYAEPMASGKRQVTAPYRDMQTAEKVFMMSVISPIIINNKPHGVVGIDIELNHLSTLIEKVRPYESGYGMLISDTGIIVAAPDRTLAGNNFSEKFPSDYGNIINKIKQGKVFSREIFSPLSHESVLEVFVPLNKKSFTAPWFFMVALPLNKAMAEAKIDLRNSMLIGLVTLLCLITLVFITASGVSNPLALLGAYAKRVAEGKHDEVLSTRGFSAELHALSGALTTMLSTLLSSMREADIKHVQSEEEAFKAKAATAEAEKATEASELSRRKAMQTAQSIQGVVERLKNTNAELVTNINTTGTRVHEQEKLMYETVEAVTHMAETTEQVLHNTEEAAGFAERTRERAKAGSAVVHDAIMGFDTVHSETKAIGDQMQDLRERTESINLILDLINDIADQTNLLALNAAIEAARAGDAGRGFAVVADEVRKLAERTMQATTQVGSAIQGIQTSMQEGSNRVTQATATAAQTLQLGSDARTSLDEIVDLVQSVTGQVQGIAKLCQHQSSSTAQIATAAESLKTLSLAVQEDMEENKRITSRLEPEVVELVGLVGDLTSDSA